jgi:signal transduction histidine kinase
VRNAFPHRHGSREEHLFARDTARPPKVFESFEYLREILDACPYLALILDQNYQLVFFNRALLSLAGTSDERRLLGLRFGQALNCTHLAENREHCGNLEACESCGALQAFKEGLLDLPNAKECRLTRTVDGRTESLDLLVSVSPIVVHEERFIVCSMRDISDEKRRQALEYIFFHDMQNTTTALDLLSRSLQGMVQGEASRFAQMIRVCASNIEEGIRSQQQLLLAENDNLAVKPATLNATQLVRDVVEVCSGSAFGEDRTIRIAAETADVFMVTDGSILKRVLRNMLKNALEASAPSETVTIGCRDAGPAVEFWVHNPGVMPKQVGLQVFQRSFSTKGSGRGLGTYSMKLLSERYLKGTITFRSNDGEGTTFLARYPKVPGK